MVSPDASGFVTGAEIAVDGGYSCMTIYNHMNNNKIAIVTGGNRGIGLGITQSFIEAGYNVLVGARQDRNLEDTFGDKVILSLPMFVKNKHITI